VGLEGSSVGQWWLDMIGKTLDEGSTFERMGSRQLAGLLIAVWSVLFSFPLIPLDMECSLSLHIGKDPL